MERDRGRGGIGEVEVGKGMEGYMDTMIKKMEMNKSEPRIQQVCLLDTSTA